MTILVHVPRSFIKYRKRFAFGETWRTLRRDRLISLVGEWPIAERARIAEVLLRLGCSLVGWMVVYTHCIWLGTLRVIGCGPDGDELWRLLLGFVPFAVGFSFLLVAIRRLVEVARILRWLAVPLVVLIPLAAIPVVSALLTSTLGSKPICGDELAVWQIWWAPVQVVALTIIAWRVYLAWRPIDNE